MRSRRYPDGAIPAGSWRPAPAARTRRSAAVGIPPAEREFFIDNLLVRIHFIIVMIRWTGLAPWEFEFPFPGSLTSTFLGIPPAPNHRVFQRWRIHDNTLSVVAIVCLVLLLL